MAKLRGTKPNGTVIEFDYQDLGLVPGREMYRSTFTCGDVEFSVDTPQGDVERSDRYRLDSVGAVAAINLGLWPNTIEREVTPGVWCRL